MSQKNLGFTPAQKDAIEQARDEMQRRLGISVNQNECVAKLCRAYLAETEAEA